MSRPFPYTYISCPCANTPVPEASRKRRSRESPQKASPEKPRIKPELHDDEDGQTFDPRSPRSNFSLYPPEQLLYCEDCHQIKCPRCITEEIVCWFCPNCMHEGGSSSLRTQGNGCTSSCYRCPVCTTTLQPSTLDTSMEGTDPGPWVLACPYCAWTTLDIGITLDKPNPASQFSKLMQGEATSVPSNRSRQMSKTAAELKSPLSMYSSVDEALLQHGEGRAHDDESTPEDAAANTDTPLNRDTRFAALKSFFKNQIATTVAASTDPLGDWSTAFSSPASLNRIITFYSSRLNGLYGGGGGGGKKNKPKAPVMREALTASEGLSIPDPDSEAITIQRMVSDDCGWDGLASLEQRASQQPGTRFVEDLVPRRLPQMTKRSKRCKSCKHILVKPEMKPNSTRFRIRLIALSYIPLPTLRPLVLPSSSSPLLPPIAPNLDALAPLKPIQLLLTLKNHMFDPVRITLATPSVTPGRVASKVTILCPQFDIGANSDVWDEALQTATAPDHHRSSRTSPYEKVAEAGKVWDKGRNWTTVVLEVVPGPLPGHSGSKLPRTTGDDDDNSDDDDNNNGDNDNQDRDDDNDDDDDSDNSDDNGPGGGNLSTNLDWSGQAKDPGQKLQPDEDVLEIPVFVRMEWESENQHEQDESVGRSHGAEKVKRELAYWMVLGVGRIE